MTDMFNVTIPKTDYNSKLQDLFRYAPLIGGTLGIQRPRRASRLNGYHAIYRGEMGYKVYSLMKLIGKHEDDGVVFYTFDDQNYRGNRVIEFDTVEGLVQHVNSLVSPPVSEPKFFLWWTENEPVDIPLIEWVKLEDDLVVGLPRININEYQFIDVICPQSHFK